MKKIIAIIPIAILFILLSSSHAAKAVTATNIGYYIYIGNDNYYYLRPVAYNFTNWAYPNNPNASSFNYVQSIGVFTSGPYNTLESALTHYQEFISNYDYHINVTREGPYYPTDTLYIVGLPYRGNDLPNVQVFDTEQDFEDYLNPPTPTPEAKWYSEMWDTLSDELGNPAFWFGQWFIDIIDQVFGNDENPSQGPSRLSDSTHIQQVTPAPTPSPIPYSTITVPRTDIITGTTVYETNYYYNNPSGTPIVATSPPTNTPTNNNNGGGSGNSQDYNPVDPYSIPQTTWFTSAEIGDTSYDGIDSIMQGFDSIDTVGSEYTDGMSVVEDSMGTLPTSWLLLIGIAAAIPLIAGIISRFLS